MLLGRVSSIVLATLAAAVPASAQRPGGSRGAPNQAAWKKLAPYTQCINDASERVFASRTSYGEWVDLKKGPSERNQFATWGIDAIGSTAECTQGLGRAATMTPRFPEVEAAAEGYTRALAEVVPLVNEAHEYYAQRDFKDDKMAKGKALHPRLMAAWDSFAAADAALRQQLFALHDRLEEEDLAWLEKTGPRLSYLRGKTMRLAKNLARSVKPPKELDLAAFQPRLEAYQAGLGELEAYLDTHKPEGQAAYIYPGFVEAGKTYMASAKELMRRKRDNKTKFDSSYPERVPGHPAHVIGAYNELVERSNQLGQ